MAHDFCGSRKKQGEGTCTRPAGWGTSHAGSGKCKLHGGATPSGAKAAQREAAEAMAVTLGLPVDTDPQEAILSAIRWAAGHVEFYRGRIQALDPEVLVWGKVKTSQGFGPQGPVDVTDEAAAVNVWLDLYDRERDRLAKLCIDAVKIGLDERRVKLAEAQATMLADGFRWLLVEAGPRMELEDREVSVLGDLIAEMMTRLDAMESGAKV